MGIADKRLAFAQAFSEIRPTTAFLQRFFVDRPGNRFNTAEVTIDIQREGEQVAIAVAPASATRVPGPDFDDGEKYTSKSFAPISYNPGFNITMDDFKGRQFGENPFASRDFKSSAQEVFVRKMRRQMSKIVRAAERQAAEVLQLGTVTPIDKNGAAVDTVTFGAKASHFPTVGTAWTNPAADAVGDLCGLADTIREDSGVDVTLALMGKNAFENFIANDDIKDRLNFRRADMINLRPDLMGGGASIKGEIHVGDNTLQIWTYHSTFDHEQTGAKTRFLDPDKVVLLGDTWRADRLSGAIERLLPRDPRLSFIDVGNERLVVDELDLYPHVWAPERGDAIHAELGSRFLMVPTQIDGYGALQTV